MRESQVKRHSPLRSRTAKQSGAGFEPLTPTAAVGLRPLPTRRVVIAEGPHPPAELVTIAATLERGWSSPAVPSACPGATSGPHLTRQQRTTPGNGGHLTSQLDSPSRPASQVVRPPRFSLARRKPGVQIPSPPPPKSPGHRPSGSHPPGRRRPRPPCRAANGQQTGTKRPPLLDRGHDDVVKRGRLTRPFRLGSKGICAAGASPAGSGWLRRRGRFPVRS
jgi:hypothetical protein